MGQTTLEEFSAKFGFTPTPNRWELRLALSVGGGLGGGPALRGWGSPLPTSATQKKKGHRAQFVLFLVAAQKRLEVSSPLLHTWDRQRTTDNRQQTTDN